MTRIFLLVVASTLISFSAASAQTAPRIIDWPETENRLGDAVADERGRLIPTEIKALSIVSISVEGRQITPGEPFEARRDWLKTLTVRLRNTSDLPIKAIRFHFLLPEAKVGDGISGFSLEYGRELSTGIDYGEQKMIAPRDEIEIVRIERHYERDSKGVAMRTGVSDFTRVLIGHLQVVLEDGTSWISFKPSFAN